MKPSTFTENTKTFQKAELHNRYFTTQMDKREKTVFQKTQQVEKLGTCYFCHSKQVLFDTIISS